MRRYTRNVRNDTLQTFRVRVKLSGLMRRDTRNHPVAIPGDDPGLTWWAKLSLIDHIEKGG